MIKLRNNRNETPGRKAFTLIEMLVVVCILMILISLVIAVSRYVMAESARKKTVAIEAVIMSAVQAFYDDQKVYPPNTPDNTDAANKYYDHGSTDLYNQLIANPKAMTRLTALPKDAVGTIGGTPSHLTVVSVFKDAWGNPIGYQHNGGLGGGPVVFSAGPDGMMFPTDDTSNGSPSAEQDNIRSDSAK